MSKWVPTYKRMPRYEEYDIERQVFGSSDGEDVFLCRVDELQALAKFWMAKPKTPWPDPPNDEKHVKVREQPKLPPRPPSRQFRDMWIFGFVETKESKAATHDWKVYIDGWRAGFKSGKLSGFVPDNNKEDKG